MKLLLSTQYPALSTSLPCICFRSGAAGARPDFVQPFELFLAELDFQRAQAASQLVNRARADDRRGYARLVQQPCQRHICRFFAHIGAEGVIPFKLGPELLNALLYALVSPPPLFDLFENAAEQTTCQRT